MHAAVRNTRVPKSHEDFNNFKIRTNNVLKQLKLKQIGRTISTTHQEPELVMSPISSDENFKIETTQNNLVEL